MHVKREDFDIQESMKSKTCSAMEDVGLCSMNFYLWLVCHDGHFYFDNCR
jgi:hypothetical protein